MPFLEIAFRVCVVVIVCAATADAQTDVLIPRSQHAWGKFEPGSWKLVRVRTENFSPEGELLSESFNETKTTLVAVDERGVTLRIEVTVDLNGRQVPVQPQVVRQGFSGEVGSQEVEVKRIGPGKVEIDGRTFTSEVRQGVFSGRGTRRIRTIHLCPKRSPFVLREETVIQDASEQEVLKTTVEVVAVDMPYELLGQPTDCSIVKTVHSRASGTTVVVEKHCPEAPGGVVEHSLRDTDAEGRVIRRSTLKLLDYGSPQRAADQRRGGLFRRVFRRKTN